LLRIIKAVKSDWLGVIWDSANLAPTPDPYKELARIAPYAVTAQVKVMTRVNGEEVRADYARLVKILRDANYRGYLVFEYEEDEDPYKAIPSHITELRKLL
ncbi:MAG: sugar phosphate isomerase/epimerase, partial [Planctomycetes bacterium]|nr:sugar phosphate isomerase/epimerase [Planctomycetota bacterium]